MRQRPDVSKIITHFIVGYMNVLFLKDTVQGQFSEREDICLGHPNSRSQDSRSKIPKSRSRNQDLEIKIQKSRSRNQDPEIKIPKSRSGNQDPEIKIQKSRSRNQDPEIKIPKSSRF